MNIKKLCYKTYLDSMFPQEADIAIDAAHAIAETVRDGDYSSLSKHSPGLIDFDWSGYIKLSSLRMARALNRVRQRYPNQCKILDYGSYFGNFALMFARAGYEVVALDSYKKYEGVFEQNIAILELNDVKVLDYERTDRLEVYGPTFDAVLSMGVIEHIPHSPKKFLQKSFELTRAGGVFILETPNIGYIYNRQKLSNGLSIHPPIEQQFDTELPFEGHHREYTLTELNWLLKKVGFDVQDHEYFNYSIYGLSQVQGRDLENYFLMEANPELRELLILTGTK